jgi:hypothetical protein
MHIGVLYDHSRYLTGQQNEVGMNTGARLGTYRRIAVFAVSLISAGCANINNPDGYWRAEAVRNTSDQGVLETEAMNDKYWSIRQLAVSKLINQSILARVALEDEVPDVRMAAVNRLTDQSALKSVAIGGNAHDGRLGVVSAGDVRIAAAERLTDQSALAEVALHAVGTSGYRVDLFAVNKLVDQGLLNRVATEAIYTDVRLAAVVKMTDQQTLVILARTDRDDSVRLTAVGALSDQASLLMFSNDSTPHFAEVAKFRRFLIHPTIIWLLGETRLTVTRTETTHYFITVDEGSRQFKGDNSVRPRWADHEEWITFKVSGGNLTSDHEVTWREGKRQEPHGTQYIDSEYGKLIDLGYAPADVNIADFEKGLLGDSNWNEVRGIFEGPNW